MRIRVFIALLNESLRFALQNIRANLLRTLLSLLGITIGVFCIIGILTFIDSLEYGIKDSISKFGNNVIFVQKWPWSFKADYPFWKYINRPEIKYREMQQLEKRFKNAEAIAYNAWIPESEIKSEKAVMKKMTIRAVSENFEKIIALDFSFGRYFSESEVQTGSNVTVLGNEVATTLFGKPEKAIGQDVFLLNRHLKVIGVMKQEGNGFGAAGKQDKMATIPLNFMRGLANFEDQRFNPSILIKGKEGERIEDLEDEIIGVMRGIRKLNPRQEENFAVNKITLLTTFLDDLFSKINLYGWIIAGFSILIGGFGIANIMFVSVKERTHIIGIQKSMGAKQYFILIQFLAEAVILCILGGLIGLFLIFILSTLLNMVLPFKLIFSIKNVLVGISISTVIGVIAGIIPARQAAKMDPIEAIRSNF